MEYKIEIWSISELVKEYKEEKLLLNPPYQRRFIWSLSDQQTLINSIISGFAIPNIFLYQKSKGKFEMVDGQQRTRTILAFLNKQFKTEDGHIFDDKRYPNFMDYKIPVTIITKIEPEESIEDFYVLVNKAGIHLNRPELKKAEYFDTNFLKLINELTDSREFQSLDLFSESSEKRMNDVDFVSELVTQQIEGVTDKKIKVDKVFEKDITLEQFKNLKATCKNIFKIFQEFNKNYAIKKTRYKQKNDLYTLFGFVSNNIGLNKKSFLHYYDLLVRFNNDITPSNEHCEPFQVYAFHCISQSNSKAAREERLNILNELFLNKGEEPNKKQKQVLKFYGLDASSENMVKIEGNLTFRLSKFPQ